jgi:hypothetical protein
MTNPPPSRTYHFLPSHTAMRAQRLAPSSAFARRWLGHSRASPMRWLRSVPPLRLPNPHLIQSNIFSQPNATQPTSTTWSPLKTPLPPPSSFSAGPERKVLLPPFLPALHLHTTCSLTTSSHSFIFLDATCRWFRPDPPPQERQAVSTPGRYSRPFEAERKGDRLQGCRGRPSGDGEEGRAR